MTREWLSAQLLSWLGARPPPPVLPPLEERRRILGHHATNAFCRGLQRNARTPEDRRSSTSRPRHAQRNRAQAGDFFSLRRGWSATATLTLRPCRRRRQRTEFPPRPSFRPLHKESRLRRDNLYRLPPQISCCAFRGTLLDILSTLFAALRA